MSSFELDSWLAKNLTYERLTNALIEIAVRNGPRLYEAGDCEKCCPVAWYDPVYEGNQEYVTAARALGIL